MSGGRDEVRSAVGGFGLSQFPQRDGPQQYTITLDEGQVGSNDDVRFAE
jgi:hypothetical protein